MQIVPVTDVKPADEFKYPPFQDAERKQNEMRKQMLEEIRKDVNAHLEEYLSALADTIESYGDVRSYGIIHSGYSDNPVAYQYLIKALRNKIQM